MRQAARLDVDGVDDVDDVDNVDVDVDADQQQQQQHQQQHQQQETPEYQLDHHEDQQHDDVRQQEKLPETEEQPHLSEQDAPVNLSRFDRKWFVVYLIGIVICILYIILDIDHHLKRKEPTLFILFSIQTVIIKCGFSLVSIFFFAHLLPRIFVLVGTAIQIFKHHRQQRFQSLDKHTILTFLVPLFVLLVHLTQIGFSFAVLDTFFSVARLCYYLFNNTFIQVCVSVLFLECLSLQKSLNDMYNAEMHKDFEQDLREQQQQQETQEVGLLQTREHSPEIVQKFQLFAKYHWFELYLLTIFFLYLDLTMFIFENTQSWTTMIVDWFFPTLLGLMLCFMVSRINQVIELFHLKYKPSDFLLLYIHYGVGLETVQFITACGKKVNTRLLTLAITYEFLPLSLPALKSYFDQN